MTLQTDVQLYRWGGGGGEEGGRGCMCVCVYHNIPDFSLKSAGITSKGM